MIIPITTIPVTDRTGRIPKSFPFAEIKNTEDMVIRVGNLPLQGTKLLVKIAISLSLGESIILQAITPAALQPNPMHMVKHCLPCEHAF